MTLPAQLKSEPVVRPSKRMLKVERVGGKITVWINYSSLELAQTCLRKFHYKLNRKLTQATESSALAYGSAVHTILEHWYTLPTGERLLPKHQYERAELYACGHNLHEEAQGPLESIRRGVLRGYDTLKALPDDDKRSLMQLVKTMRSYFNHYADDQLVVATDEHGPIIERDFEFLLHEEPGLEIWYFGTIDVVLMNAATQLLMVADHKTTSILGKEFYARCKPNPQYTGYVLGAQKCLGLDTNLFMINGIQVAKNPQFARQVTTRNDDDFQELKLTVIEQASRILRAQEAQLWPMTSPNPCSMYGGCEYHKICEVPENLKEAVIRSMV